VHYRFFYILLFTLETGCLCLFYDKEQAIQSVEKECTDYLYLTHSSVLYNLFIPVGAAAATGSLLI